MYVEGTKKLSVTLKGISISLPLPVGTREVELPAELLEVVEAVGSVIKVAESTADLRRRLLEILVLLEIKP